MFRGDWRKKKQFFGDEVMANILEMEKGGQDLDLDNLGSGITSAM